MLDRRERGDPHPIDVQRAIEVLDLVLEMRADQP